jgi:hypothetical protein
MFKPNTLLVVGAGASAEAGLPLGTELVEQIAGLVKFERDSLTGRLPELNEFVREMMNYAGPERIGQYERAAAQMIAGMRSAESVDRFIDRNRDDEFIRTLGKAAIVRAIAFKERKSQLHEDKGGPILGKSWIDTTWYWAFVRILLEGSPPPEKLFDDVAIICFNYDRCIEHYLTCELVRSYHIDRKEAAALVSRLTIWHPYGTIAPLDTQEINGVAFGGTEAIRGRTFELAKRIKTFTEKHEDTATIEAMRTRLRTTNTVVFLGFGYYQQNLDLIKPDEEARIHWVLGTGVGLSDSARHVVEQKHLGPWSKGSKTETPEMTCGQLLNHYRMQLSA